MTKHSSVVFQERVLANKHLSSPHSRQSSKHLRNMKPMKRKSDCPWTSTQKRKKQRKTTKSISEHKKTTLAQSDKGSWFDQVKWLEEEESNASVSARKLCSEMDSENLTEKRNNIVVTMHEYPRGGLTFAYHYSFFKIINHYLKCFLSSVICTIAPRLSP